MKYFSICLLMVLFGSGTVYSQPETTVDNTQRPKLHRVTIIDGPLLTLDSLLAWYDQYAAECYVDSSVKSGWVFQGAETSPGSGVLAGYDTWETWTVHRQPDLVGFMNFLRKRAQP